MLTQNYNTPPYTFVAPGTNTGYIPGIVPVCTGTPQGDLISLIVCETYLDAGLKVQFVIFQYDPVTGELVVPQPGQQNPYKPKSGNFQYSYTLSVGGSLWQFKTFTDGFGLSQMQQVGNYDLQPQGSPILASFFGGISAIEGVIGIDDQQDFFIIGNSNDLRLDVYQWTTGTFLYSILMPTGIVGIAMLEDGCCYVVMENGLVLTVNYKTGIILGAVRLPPPNGATSYSDTMYNGAVVAFYPQYNRLLVIFPTPDSTEPTAFIQGFRMQPSPVRLTTPIPLETPLAGKTIPVLVQVLDDMNFGVGGCPIVSTVSGDGTKTGIAVTDKGGSALVYVECDSAGTFDIDCSATVQDIVVQPGT